MDKQHFQRYLDGLYVQSEAKSILKEAIKEENREIFGEICREQWDESLNVKNAQEDKVKFKAEAKELLRSLYRKRTVPINNLMKFIAAGAAIVLLVVLFDHSLDMSLKKTDYTSVSTSFGEIKKIELADGSTVVLNSKSILKYPRKFTKDERKVLLDGQAYFVVSPQKNKPFIVDTEIFDVKVLGTRFDVKAYNDDEIVSVNVESGKVEINTPELRMQLKAKEKTSLNILTGEVEKQLETSSVALWRKGILHFDRTPIGDVAKVLERMYNHKFIFQEGQEFKEIISGDHDNKNLESVLYSIELISGIKHKRINDHTIQLYK